MQTLHQVNWDEKGSFCEDRNCKDAKTLASPKYLQMIFNQEWIIGNGSRNIGHAMMGSLAGQVDLTWHGISSNDHLSSSL